MQTLGLDGLGTSQGACGAEPADLGDLRGSLGREPCHSGGEPDVGLFIFVVVLGVGIGVVGNYELIGTAFGWHVGSRDETSRVTSPELYAWPPDQL